MQINLELFFFYHNDASRSSIQALDDVRGCHLVDLNDCALPETLDRFASDYPNLDAILSEYTGHMSVVPTAGQVGLFNYSLFDKFSYRWAMATGNVRVFLPRIPQRGLLQHPFAGQTLSYIEATPGHHLWYYLEEAEAPDDVIGFLKARYPVADTARVPLKGSYVLDKDVFLDYQSWLKRELPVLLDALKEVRGGPVSRFSESRLGDDARTRLQQNRHIVGGACERIAGWYLAQHYKSKTMVRVGNSLRRQSQSLLDAAQSAADANGNVVLVFCNSSYRPILDNWLCNAEGTGDQPLVICALDEELAADMADAGFNTCHVPWSGNLSELWRLRLRVIRELLAAGFNVIHSDADAVWKQDPISIVDDIDADIVASQGTVWPRTTLAAWGHVLCFGFIGFRATPATLNVIDRLVAAAEDPEIRFDDQKALNELLTEIGMEWDAPDGGYQLHLNDTPFVCHDQSILGSGVLEDGTPIRVGLLPHRQVQRLPNEVENPADRIVAHPFAEKTAGDTEKVLRDQDCWVMPEPKQTAVAR